MVAWHPVHETLFASGGSDGSLMFWLTGYENIDDDFCLAVLTTMFSLYILLTFSVDEKAGGMEKAHEGIVWSLSWHPLGHILCSGSNDHTRYALNESL